jgi:hypothetical protein
MLETLKRFIREELVWNYWLRRPRNNQVKGAGPRIQQWRRDMYEPVADTFEEEVGQIRHAVWTATGVHDLEDRLLRKGLDAYEIAADPTLFQQAYERNDVAEMKRQVINGLERWAREVLKNTEDDDFNVSTLQGFVDPEV